MKNLFLLFLAISLQCCNGQEKNNINTNKTIDKQTSDKNKGANDAPINFLDNKYQTQGFNIPDTQNPFPTYSFSDEKIGKFTVDYIGKTNTIQYFWNVNNTAGYFSKYSKPEDAANKSDDIKKYINHNDYYIIATYLPQKYISYNGGIDGEFDLKPDAKTSFYLYENNKWRLINETEIDKIPENLLAFETYLIQKELLKDHNNFSESYYGLHSVFVETEATTTGMASVSYSFEIKKNDIKLSLDTYHESNTCEGKYFANEKNNQLEIYYLGSELSCISMDPKFYIKKEGKKIYIKGVGGEETINKWILMK